MVAKGVLETEVEPIKNPVTGEPHRIQVVMPEGFEHIAAEVASANIRSTGAIKFEPRARIARSRSRPDAGGRRGLALANPNLTRRPVAGGFMMGTWALEQTLRHDRLIVAIGIATVVAFSWGLPACRRRHRHEHGRHADGPRAMVAGPGIAHVRDVVGDDGRDDAAERRATILLFAAIKRGEAAGTAPSFPPAFSRRLSRVWAGSARCDPRAVGLQQAGLLSGMMATTSDVLAGNPHRRRAWQFTPIKRACLRSASPRCVSLNAGGRELRRLRMGLARHLLLRLLLVPDGAAVRRRRHEPRLGRCGRDLCRLRETAAAQPMAQPHRGRRPDRGGRNRARARPDRHGRPRRCSSPQTATSSARITRTRFGFFTFEGPNRGQGRPKARCSTANKRHGQDPEGLGWRAATIAQSRCAAR